MFNQNVVMFHAGGHEYVIHLKDEVLDDLFTRFGGQVNVKVGKPEAPGTEQQNRAMHALLQEYYITGMHSAPEGCTFADFKIFMKLEHGPSWQLDYKGQQVRVPKSWADYTKQERADFITALISEIHQSGAYAESAKIREIISGMEEQ